MDVMGELDFQSWEEWRYCVDLPKHVSLFVEKFGAPIMFHVGQLIVKVVNEQNVLTKLAQTEEHVKFN